MVGGIGTVELVSVELGLIVTQILHSSLLPLDFPPFRRGHRIIHADRGEVLHCGLDLRILARAALRPQTLDAAEEKRVEPVFTQLMSGHAKRMAAIGLDA